MIIVTLHDIWAMIMFTFFTIFMLGIAWSNRKNIKNKLKK